MIKNIRLVLKSIFFLLILTSIMNTNTASVSVIEMNGEKIAIFIADGTSKDDFEDVITPLENLGCEITVAGIESEHINDNAETMVANILIADLDMTDYDCIYIPGGDGAFVLADSTIVISKVISAYNEGLTMGAFCSGPAVLAEADLVDGRFVTGEWPNMYSFSYSLAIAMGYSYVENVSIEKTTGSNILITVQTSPDDIFITSVNVNISHLSNTSDIIFIENIELTDDNNNGNFTAEALLEEKEGIYIFDVKVEDFFDNIEIHLEAVTYSPTGNNDNSIPGFLGLFLLASFISIAIYKRKFVKS